MGASLCGRAQCCCQSSDGGLDYSDEPAALIFSEDWAERLSLPPLVQCRSSRELEAVRTPTPHHRSKPGTPKTPKTPKTPRVAEDVEGEHAGEDDDSDDDGPQKAGLVRVEDDFDFFDPSSKSAQVLPLVSDVVHQRLAVAVSPGRALEPLPLQRGEQALPRSRSATMTPKTRARCEVEVLTRWAVLAGKVIFHRVLTLTTMSSMFVNRAKMVRADKNPTVWRRIQGRAWRVVNKAAALAGRISKESVDRLDSEWKLAEGGALTDLFTSEYVDTLMILAKASQKLFASQPVLAEAKAPCRVFGDIHGQLRDLLLLFAAFGFPGSKDESESQEVSFVFNGDFVDRGQHSLEVIGLLLALKVAMPHKVWLVRGNHEDRTMNSRYGFQEECLDRLGDDLGQKTYDLLQDVFEQLPLACLVGGKVLCVHGGVGDGRWSLNDLRAVRRPLGPQELGSAGLRWVHNILWSDPIEDDRESRCDDGGPVFGVHESPRRTSAVLFGWDVTKTFCARNGVDMVVRSHQSKKNGLGFDLMHDSMLMRVFSARDYEGHGNDGAVLLIQRSDGSEGDGSEPRPLTVRAQVLRSFAKAQAAASAALPSLEAAAPGGA
eukprot:gb/GFBE01061788.1/.p1 GENE.gb/GFBE01061788.1/~~gb/GFBE01061788.1/.p1  ORF type:complete len:603 (+),score=106.49 gb/GFBE01061788.1/:1-1809(+)